MGCCGDREKGLTVTEEQKWDYIVSATLSDFKSTSCLTPLSYAWLWILVLISGAVYAADAFTAVNLLAFDKWSSEVKPKVPFDVAKWIFAITIILSYVFLIYRWVMALRVIRSGSVAACYLEPLAAIWQSMRLTKEGQGWRRFLVFAELTTSRKGVDYVALFSYFQFKGALLIVVAQGPRMAINAMTLWAVMQAQIIPVGEHAASEDRSNFEQFFINIQTMTRTGNMRETIIYGTMFFSLFIWAIAALSLLLSVLFYVCFLLHYIPKSDGTLGKYCRRKIDTRLERIVGKTVKKALEKQDLKRRREEEKAMKKGQLDKPSQRVPTLPKLGGKDDDASSIRSFGTVSTTLPPYSSNAPSRTNTMSTTATTSTRTATMRPSLPSLNERPFPQRSDTQGTNFSTASYGSNAPLLSQAGGMGLSSPTPPLPTLDRNADYFDETHSYRPMPQGQPPRSYSPMSQGRGTPRPQRAPYPRVDTDYSNGRASPAPQLITSLPGDVRGPSPAYGHQAYPNDRAIVSPLGGPSFSPYEYRDPAGPSYEMSPVEVTPVDNFPQQSRENFRPPQLPNALRVGSPAPAPGANFDRTSPPPLRSGTAPPSNPRAGLPPSLQSAIQRREASQPLPNRGMASSVPPPQQRSVTAPPQRPGWGQGPTPRSNTTAPGPRGYDNSYGRGPQGGENRW
ncbi:hypothetical protein BDV95DRAFT_496866 [Massariosphaeria phaeospora]|uniref:Vacuolar membrane protein n=1 Tax=Massariosphaeria phaeospora TaxID=100035 RepID=A0A7C8IBW5_9PLEO|nr:hypothetical protein BDV95DRAFT_496866 [Massariosphaeria phaeospora]